MAEHLCKESKMTKGIRYVLQSMFDKTWQDERKFDDKKKALSALKDYREVFILEKARLLKETYVIEILKD